MADINYPRCPRPRPSNLGASMRTFLQLGARAVSLGQAPQSFPRIPPVFPSANHKICVDYLILSLRSPRAYCLPSRISLRLPHTIAVYLESKQSLAILCQYLMNTGHLWEDATNFALASYRTAKWENSDASKVLLSISATKYQTVSNERSVSPMPWIHQLGAL
jgi:hypothetical protein